MKAEIISVGTELTTGQNLDTNCQWLSRRLAELGIAVGFHTTLSDDREDNVAAYRHAASRAKVILITGGLGPTLDDLTRDALARAAGVDLRFDVKSFDAIVAMFASRGRAMPERNRTQAFFPTGAEVLPNPIGTAPGIWMRLGDAWIAAMPGVPREMFEMFDSQVRPRLVGLGLCSGVVIERKLNTFGAGESAVEEMLGDLTARGRVPEVGITASGSIISLRIVARAPNAQAAADVISPVEAEIRRRLGNMVVGTDSAELHEVCSKLLFDGKLTVATAESITAGEVAQRLSRVAGASNWLRGGIIAYTNDAKSRLLGVSEELLRVHGAVSAPVVEAMAVGCRERFGSDIGLATTGLAGPSDGGEGKPVGLTFVGLAGKDGVISRQVHWFGSRQEVQTRCALSALNLLRLWLIG